MNLGRKYRSPGIFLVAVLFTGAIPWMMPFDASHAATYEGTYTYGVTDQSMWGSGQATDLNYNQFFGTSWNTSRTVGDITSFTIWNPFGDDPRVYAGAEIYGHTEGKVGVDVGATVNSGSVDISQQSTVQLVAPDVINSTQQLIVSSSALFGTGSISTQSPTVSAYVDLVLELEADIRGEVCVAGCISASSTLVDESWHPELLALNRDNDGQARLLGTDLGVLPVTASAGPVELTLTPPVISTSGEAPPQPLSSSGTSDFIDLSVDIASLASTSLGFPLSGSVGIGSAGIGYSLLSAGFGLDLGFYQNFAFASATPQITLDVVETGLSYSFYAGQDSPVIDPMGFDLLNITSTLDFSGVLTSATGLNLTPYGFLEMFSANAFGLGFGPLVDWTAEFGTLPISLFGGETSIDFDEFDGPSFQVAINRVPAPVPEPGTLFLLAGGLASLAGIRRWRGCRREGFLT